MPAVAAGVTGAIAGACLASAVSRGDRRCQYAPRRADVVVVSRPAPLGMPSITNDYRYAGVPPEPPLAVAFVQLLPSAIETRGDVTYFGVDVSPADGTGASWRVLRRYNDFDNLATQLGPKARTLRDAPFPRKHLFGCTGETLEVRRCALQTWLQRVLTEQHCNPYWSSPLRAFLEKPAVNPDALLPSAPPPLPPPSSPPPPAAPLASAPPQEEALALFSVDVPPGVGPGQHLSVTVPGDGRQFLVEVPPGAAAGTPLELWFDAEAGTLSVRRQ